MYPLEKLSNRGCCKINIWKTEGMLELSSRSEHPAAALENLLPSHQNAFSHTPALAQGTAAVAAPSELLPALQGARGWSGWAVPTLSVCRVLHGWSFAVVTLSCTMTGSASFHHQTRELSLCSLRWEHPLLSAVQRLSDKQVLALPVRSSILPHGWIPARTGMRPMLTTGFVLKKWQTQWGGQEQDRLSPDVVWKHLFCKWLNESFNLPLPVSN